MRKNYLLLCLFLFSAFFTHAQDLGRRATGNVNPPPEEPVVAEPLQPEPARPQPERPPPQPRPARPQPERPPQQPARPQPERAQPQPERPPQQPVRPQPERPQNPSQGSARSVNPPVPAVAMEEEEEPEKSGWGGFKNRMVEISLHVDAHASNDFITAMDFFQETALINIDEFLDGFRFNFGVGIKPFSFSFNWKDRWGFGLDVAHIEAFGNLALPNNMMTLQETDDERFGLGAAVFAEMLGIPVFFHVKDFKLSIRPAAYVPIFYAEPGFTYRHQDGRISVSFDKRIYSAIGMEDLVEDGTMPDFDPWEIAQNNMGYDLSFGLEYPLFSWLDLGTSMVNIPLPFAMAKLSHYMYLDESHEVFIDTNEIDIGDLIDSGKISEDAYKYPEEFNPEYSTGNKLLQRPFTMLAYANYRPFNRRILTLIPSIGFSHNLLYSQPWAIEGGLSARCNLGNLFITTLGVNYNDRRWKNSLDFALNFRVIELGFGVSVQSQDFVKSFQGAGLGAQVGLKFGW